VAGYSAVIDLRVDGIAGLRTVKDNLTSITNLVKNLKPVPTLFSTSQNAELKTAKNQLSDLVKAYADGNTRVAKFSTSIAGLSNQLNTFRTVAANAKTGTDQFTNALKAAEVASNKLISAELTRLSTLKDLYTRQPVGGLSAESQGPSGLTKSVLELGKQLPASISGLRTYQAELSRVFDLVEAGSIDFRTLQAEIARVNNQMDIMQGAGPVQGPALPPSMRGNAGRGGLSSPVGGAPGMAGSPAARAAMQENLMLGAGFPLLFGGGAGQVAGGLLGSFVGTGFGGQILGAAIGQILEDAQRRITEIGNAVNQLNMNAFRDSVVYVNAELDTTVRRLIEAGDAQAAQNALAEAAFEQTGMLPAAVNDITTGVNLLSNNWNKFLGAVSGTLAIIGVPFVAALNILLGAFTKIFQFANLILTTIGGWIKQIAEGLLKLPVVQFIIERILNDTTATREEDEKRNAELQKAVDTLTREADLAEQLLGLEMQRAEGSSYAAQIYNQQIDLQKQLMQLQNEYDNKRREAQVQYAGLQLEAYNTQLDRLERAKAIELEFKAIQAIRILELKRADAERSVALERQNAQLQVQNNLISKQTVLTQTLNDSQIALNNLQIDYLEFLNRGTRDLAFKIRLLNTIRVLEKENAKLALESAKAQIASQERLAALAYQQAALKLKNLEIDYLSAAARGDELTNYAKAIYAGEAALQIAYDNYNFTVKTGEAQLRVAEAIYKAAIRAADLKFFMSAAAAQAEAMAGSSERVAAATERTKAASEWNVLSKEKDPSKPGYYAERIDEQGRMETIRTYAKTSGMVILGKGGYATGPTKALIGEAGEGEYVIPESKAAGFAMNYLTGARGDSAIPRMAEGGYVGPINIQTGPVLQQDNNRYVTLGDMENALQTLAATLLTNGRTTGGRRFQGV
jgi:hypothetical protein